MKLSFISLGLSNFKGIVGNLAWDYHKTPGFYFVRGVNKAEPRLGGNGVGKSTIMIDAPYWVLTGKTVLSQRPGALVENWRSGKNTKGVLVIKLDDEPYVIERGRNPSLLTINGKAVAQEEIDKLLPLSDAALRRTLLLGQRSSLFLDLRPEDKSRLFTETLELDRWIQASANAGDKLSITERELHLIRADTASAESLLNILKDQHDEAADKEEQFGSDKVARLAKIGLEITQTRQELEGVRDALSEARRAYASLEVSETLGGETPSQRLENLRSQEKIGRSTLGRTEANLQAIRREEEKTKDLIDKYEQSENCPECGQVVDKEHVIIKVAELTEKSRGLQRLGDNLAREANTLDMRLLRIAQDIRDVEQKSGQINQIKHEIDIAEVKERTLDREYNRLQTERDKITTEANPFTTMCDDLERKFNDTKASITKMEGEEAQLVKDAEIYKFWQKGFKDIRLELIDSTLMELQLTTKRNAEALGLEGWDIAFSTERETKSGNVSQAFTVLLYPPGQREPIDWSAFSGGESQRWHIAVTCALSEVLLNRAGIEPDIEIYDEITNYISSEGIDDVMEFLKERSIELGRKIYLIDHHIGVGDFTDVVEITKDEAGVQLLAKETVSV